MEPNERVLVRPSEAAEMMSISRSKVYELISKGDIQSVRIGSSVRIPVEAIRALGRKPADQVPA